MELQPCPFCGCAEVSMTEDWTFGFGGLCHECGTEGSCAPTREDAVAAWNRRASRSPVVGAVGGEPPKHEVGLESYTVERLRRIMLNLGIPNHGEEWLFANTDRALLDVFNAAEMLMARFAKSPASPTAAGPMTEEQALAAARKALDGPDATDDDYGPNTLNMVWFRTICLPIVRAVEAFHGIGVSPTGSREGEVK